MVDLLKQKSKVGIAQKERKRYDVADVFKKAKTADGQTFAFNQTNNFQNTTSKTVKTVKKIVPNVLEEKMQEDNSK